MLLSRLAMKAVCLIAALLLLSGFDPFKQQNTTVEQKTHEQRKQIYYDNKNGYFTVLPPTGWKQKNFPNEVVRSKIEFINAQNDGVNIRVIVAPTQNPSMSNDELLSEIQNKVRTVLRPRYPSINWSAHKEIIDDRETVVILSSGPGIEQRIIQFIHKGLNYSIALNAKSKKNFQIAEPAFNDFVSSFTILESGKTITDADRTKAQIARLKRIAVLRQQEGHIADALNFVDEALALDPNNAQLKEFQQRLRSEIKGDGVNQFK